MWIFFMGIKFREDSHSRVFNFAIILRSRKTQNFRPAKVSRNKVSTCKTHTFTYRPFWGWLGRYWLELHHKHHVLEDLTQSPSQPFNNQ